jgi:hypothetical protein
VSVERAATWALVQAVLALSTSPPWPRSKPELVCVCVCVIECVFWVCLRFVCVCVTSAQGACMNVHSTGLPGVLEVQTSALAHTGHCNVVLGLAL